jgi:hypothetical protein
MTKTVVTEKKLKKAQFFNRALREDISEGRGLTSCSYGTVSLDFWKTFRSLKAAIADAKDASISLYDSPVFATSMTWRNWDDIGKAIDEDRQRTWPDPYMGTVEICRRQWKYFQTASGKVTFFVTRGKRSYMTVIRCRSENEGVDGYRPVEERGSYLGMTSHGWTFMGLDNLGDECIDFRKISKGMSPEEVVEKSDQEKMFPISDWDLEFSVMTPHYVRDQKRDACREKKIEDFLAQAKGKSFFLVETSEDVFDVVDSTGKLWFSDIKR